MEYYFIEQNTKKYALQQLKHQLDFKSNFYEHAKHEKASARFGWP